MDYLLDLLHDLLLQICQCLIFLKEPLAVADILEKLSAGSSTDALMAYQIVFDMYVSATQQFLSRVLAAIRKTAPGVEEVTEGQQKGTQGAGLAPGGVLLRLCGTGHPAAGGRLAEKYGGNTLYGGGVLVTSILTLLTPLAANTSIYLFSWCGWWRAKQP